MQAEGCIGSSEVDMKIDQDEEMYLQIPLVGSAILPLTLKTVLELGVFEILVKGCASHSAGTQPAMMTADDIAVQLPTKNPQAAVMLDRMLGLLGSFNIVTCTIEEKENVIVRRYGPAPIFKWLAKNEDGATAANLIYVLMEQAYLSAGRHLKEAVLEGGIAFEKAHGMTTYEYMMRTDPKFSIVFLESVKGHLTRMMNKMLETYQGIKDVQILVDVGSGVGATLGVIIVAKYPHIKCINLALPHGISDTTPLFPGVRHVGEDMFAPIPHGDAILLKWVLHNWSDEHCVKILKNCYMALPNKGKVIVVDYVYPATPQATTSSQSAFILDVTMLINFGAKVRTKKEFETLAKEAGFTKVETQYIWAGTWLFELKK